MRTSTLLSLSVTAVTVVAIGWSLAHHTSTPWLINGPDAVAVATTSSVIATSSIPRGAQPYVVTRVVDGDTFKATRDGKVETIRVLGIDTPETVKPRVAVQCFGEEASHEAQTLLTARTVFLVGDPTQDTRDKYGRLLVYVYRDDGLFYDEYMISAGFAHEYTYRVPYHFQQLFKQDQREAQENGRGLWSPTACPTS